MYVCMYVRTYVCMYVYCYNLMRWPRQLRPYSETLRAGRSRDRILVRGENLRTVHTMGPTQTPVQWVPSLSGGLSHRSVVMTTAFWRQGCEWVDLYFYLPAGPAEAYHGVAFTLTLRSEVLQKPVRRNRLMLQLVWKMTSSPETREINQWQNITAEWCIIWAGNVDP